MAHSRSRDGDPPGPNERRQPPGISFKWKKVKILGRKILIKVYSWRGTKRKKREEIFANCGLKKI